MKDLEKCQQDLETCQQEIRRLRSIVRNKEWDVTDRLAKFEYNVDQDEFKEIFGSKMGEHLWGKFHLFHHSILMLWGVLDPDNRKKLADYLYLH